MANITKRQIVNRITEETGLIQSQTLGVVQKFLDHIIEALSENKRVEFRNFGVFEVVTRKEMIGRNPKDPQKEIFIPERKIIKFKPVFFSRLKQLVLNPINI